MTFPCLDAPNGSWLIKAGEESRRRISVRSSSQVGAGGVGGRLAGNVMVVRRTVVDVVDKSSRSRSVLSVRFLVADRGVSWEGWKEWLSDKTSGKGNLIKGAESSGSQQSSEGRGQARVTACMCAQ